jgi:hypothetical protein
MRRGESHNYSYGFLTVTEEPNLVVIVENEPKKSRQRFWNRGGVK